MRDKRAETEKPKSKKAISTPLFIVVPIWLSIRFADRFAGSASRSCMLNKVLSSYAANSEDKPYGFSLLVDPLANEIIKLPEKYGFDEDELILQTTPFQSLEPEIILRRAQQILQPPETVTFTSENDILFIRGKALLHWVDHTKQISTAISGYKHMDITGLLPDYSEIIKQASEALRILGSVTADFDGQELRLSGTALVTWVLWQKSQSISIPEVVRADADYKVRVEIKKNSKFTEQDREEAIMKIGLLADNAGFYGYTHLAGLAREIHPKLKELSKYTKEDE